MSDPINDPINDLKEIEREIYFAIKKHPGVRKVSLIPMVGKSEATVKRALKQLSKNNLIEYRGSKKTGGYFII
ncbi:MAG: winged helix-turn-helix transcriptional regulator [Muribaculaceae bacterium]|nr:winged helix-turn-helix transcriptional regulator [Muribaculaceae bacterium]